jgi:hypothetical protein
MNNQSNTAVQTIERRWQVLALVNVVDHIIPRKTFPVSILCALAIRRERSLAPPC